MSFDDCLNLPLTEFKCLPDRLPAVYVIYVSPCIALYIGATVSLKDRLREHSRALGSIRNIRLAWFPLPISFHRETERRLIQAHCPPLNVCHRPGGKATGWIHRGRLSKLKTFIRQRQKSTV